MYIHTYIDETSITIINEPEALSLSSTLAEPTLLEP